MRTEPSGSFLFRAGSMMGRRAARVGSGSVHVCRYRCGAHDSTGVEIMTVLESRNDGSFHRGGQCGFGFALLSIVCGLGRDCRSFLPWEWHVPVQRWLLR